jgi:hypothetical protein
MSEAFAEKVSGCGFRLRWPILVSDGYNASGNPVTYIPTKNQFNRARKRCGRVVSIDDYSLDIFELP